MKIAGRSDAQRAVPDDEPVKPGQIEPVDLRENAVRLETGLLLEPADGADGGKLHGRPKVASSQAPRDLTPKVSVA